MGEIVLITGASRGIGREYVRQYLERGSRVFATCRNPSEAAGLQALAEAYPDTCHVLRMDVTKDDEIRAAAEEAAAHTDRLDVLVNNAGIFAEGEAGLETVESAKMLHVLHVDAVAPVIVTKYFLPLLRKAEHARVVNITSGAGVLTKKKKTPNGQYSYGAGKAALNMAIKSMAADMAPLGIIAIGLGPGFVETDMTRGGSRQPPLQPRESVAGMIRVIDALTPDDAGAFRGHDGAPCDWEIG